MSRVLSFEEDVMSLVVDSKNDVIIAGYENGYLNVWDVRCPDNPIFHGRFSEKDDVTSAVIAPDSDPSIFYAAAGKSIYRVDSRKVSDAATWSSAIFECLDDINQIVISENVLVTADDNHDVSLFDTQKNSLLCRWNKHKNCVSCVGFNPSKSRQLISGGYDCALVQWDVVKRRNLSSVNVSTFDDPEWKLPTAFNPAYVLSCDVLASKLSNNVCVAGTENGNLHLFRCEKKLNHVRTFRAHDLGITQAKFVVIASNQQEELIVSGGNDMKIKTWNLDQLMSTETISYEPLTTVNHNSKINWLSFHNCAFVVSDTSPNISIIPMN